MAGAALAASLIFVVARQQYSPVAAIIAGVATVVLLVDVAALRRRPVWAAALALNVALTLLYFWSWDESHLVLIHVTRAGAVAKIDGDTISMLQPVTAGQVGLQQAAYGSYRFQATGEAVQNDVTTPLARLARALRLSAPTPAWSDLAVSSPSGSSRLNATSALPLQSPPQSWSGDGNGQISGGEGAFALAKPAFVPPYTITVRLSRPEGSQNIMFGVGPAGRGYALQVRFDQPDSLFVRWDTGSLGPAVGATELRDMNLIANLQRATRSLLVAYPFAALFLLLSLGLYPVLLGLFTGFKNTSTDDLESVRRFVERPRFAIIFGLCLIACALAATGAVSTFLLDRMPHVQDSVAYLFQAKIFAGGHLNAPAPASSVQPFFLEEYMPFYGAKWFSQYPPGHPLMLTLGVLLGAPWLVEPILASVTLWFVYLLGKRVYGSAVGIIAALLGLSSPFWLFLGSSFMAHATGLFFGAGCFLSFALAENTGVGRAGGGQTRRSVPTASAENPRDGRAGRGETRGTVAPGSVQDTGKRQWVLVMGFCAGMLFLTRQITAAGLLGPLALYALFFSRRGWKAYLPAIGAFCVPAVFLLLYQWVQMGGPLESTYAAWSSHYTLGFGPDASPSGPFTAADGLWNGYQNLSMLSVHLYGWPYGVALAFMALPFVLGAARRWDFLLLASFAGIVGIHMLYWCGCLMYGPRFYYEALPSILLLSARGVVELFRLPLRVWTRFHLASDASVAAFFPAMLIAALFIYNGRFYMPAQLTLYDKYNYSSNAELTTVRRAHLHHAVVFVVTNPPGFWASYGNVFFANDPRLKGDIVFAHDMGVSNRILSRFFPGRGYYRLNGTTLTRIS
ncbi:MAG: ArnT family glycosyltransferase [Chloroflexota bacterium]|nr:MAG: hypothetical protein DLM70_17840 [Chloroflexota bacterium]